MQGPCFSPIVDISNRQSQVPSWHGWDFLRTSSFTHPVVLLSAACLFGINQKPAPQSWRLSLLQPPLSFEFHRLSSINFFLSFLTSVLLLLSSRESHWYIDSCGINNKCWQISKCSLFSLLPKINLEGYYQVKNKYINFLFLLQEII